jgi:cytochrome b561
VVNVTDVANPQSAAPTRYDRVAISFHWISALLIITLLFNGLFMTKLSDGDFTTNIYRFHVAVGSLVLLLTVLRLVWAWRHPAPAPLEMPSAERMMYRGIHYLLYAGAILTAVSGTLMILNSGMTPIATEVIVSEIDRSSPVRNVHWLLAMGMLVLLVAHIGGVVMYQRSKGKTLSRIGIGSD